MKKIYLLIFSVVFLLLACRAKFGKLSEVKKIIIYPGIKYGTKYIKYTAKFTILKPIRIKKIEIILPEKNIIVNDYKILTQEKKITSINNSFLQKGTYFFETYLTYAPELSKEKDKLKIYLEKKSGHTTILIASITKEKDIMRM